MPSILPPFLRRKSEEQRSLRQTRFWYDPVRSEVSIKRMQEAARLPENVRKARVYLESLKEDFKALNGGEIPPYSPDLCLPTNERRANPFYDSPTSPWNDPESRPPTPETVTVGTYTGSDGTKFKNILKSQSREQHRNELLSQELREIAIRLAIAEEKTRLREEALGFKPAQHSLEAPTSSPTTRAEGVTRALGTDVTHVRALGDEQFLEEAKASGKVLEAKAEILQMDGYSIDHDLKLSEHEGTLLHLAARFNHVSTVSYLLGRGATIDILNGIGKTPLEMAVEADAAGAITELLANGASTKDAGQHYYLHKAQSKDVALKLLKSGVPIDLMDEDSMTALHVSVGHRRSDVVKVLLSWRKQPNVDAQDCDGWTPLHYAAWVGEVEIIKEVLRYQPNLAICDSWGANALEIAFTDREENDEEDGEDEDGSKEDAATVLFRAYVEDSDQYLGGLATKLLIPATARGDLELLEVVLKQKPNLDIKGFMGRTALHEAAETNKVATLKRLLDAGANPDLADDDGKTPLYLAEGKGNVAVANMLLGRGAKHLDRPHTPPPGPDAPIAWSRLSDGARLIATPLGEFLVEDGPPAGSSSQKSPVRNVLEKVIIMRDKPYEHALLNAAMKGHVPLMKGLLKAGAHANHKDELGLAALHGAAAYGQLETIRVLKQAKADINVRSNVGWTPLYLAAHEGQADAIRILIKYGASLDSVAEDGQTPLWAAASNGYPGAVEAIVKTGKKIDRVEAKRAMAQAMKVSQDKRSKQVGQRFSGVTEQLMDRSEKIERQTRTEQQQKGGNHAAVVAVTDRKDQGKMCDSAGRSKEEGQAEGATAASYSGADHPVHNAEQVTKRASSQTDADGKNHYTQGAADVQFREAATLRRKARLQKYGKLNSTSDENVYKDALTEAVYEAICEEMMLKSKCRRSFWRKLFNWRDN